MQNYYFAEWNQQEQSYFRDLTIPFQLCNRSFKKLREIHIEPLLKNPPFDSFKKSIYRHKRTGDKYLTGELALATGRFLGEKIVPYTKGLPQKNTVYFCRVLEDFLEKFEEVKQLDEVNLEV